MTKRLSNLSLKTLRKSWLGRKNKDGEYPTSGMQDFLDGAQIPIDDTWTVYGNTTGAQCGPTTIHSGFTITPTYTPSYTTTTYPPWNGTFSQGTINFPNPPNVEYTNIPTTEYNMYKVREEIGTLMVLGKIDPEQFRNMWELSKSEDKEVINLLRIMISEIQTRLINELV